MKPIITILVGPPGSGKTTWAKEYLSQHGHREDLVYINQDIQGKEGHLELFTKALSESKDIVVDRMNFSKKQRLVYLHPAKQKKYSTRIVVLHTPYQTCLDRISERTDHPTIKTNEDAKRAVHFFFSNYGRVKDTEANEVMRMGWTHRNDAEKVIVCDLDGTLANVAHRLHHIKEQEVTDLWEKEEEKPEFKVDWTSFFEEMISDPVNEWCRVILNSLQDTYRVVYATGRPSDYLEHSSLWLAENSLRFPGSELFMRPEGDYRSDDTIKEIILEFEIKTRYDVLFILDDRAQVVDMWRKHGYTVLQCAKGQF